MKIKFKGHSWWSGNVHCDRFLKLFLESIQADFWYICSYFVKLLCLNFNWGPKIQAYNIVTSQGSFQTSDCACSHIVAWCATYSAGQLFFIICNYTQNYVSQGNTWNSTSHNIILIRESNNIIILRC